ncbi:MAG: hypothetical protein ACKVQS_10550 [Fimbriimonadaceae bacterium]
MFATIITLTATIIERKMLPKSTIKTPELNKNVIAQLDNFDQGHSLGKSRADFYAIVSIKGS